MKQTWCKNHKKWEPNDEACGSRFNKALRTAQLNSHLYAQAGAVTKEKTDSAHFVRQAKLEQQRVAHS